MCVSARQREECESVRSEADDGGGWMKTKGCSGPAFIMHRTGEWRPLGEWLASTTAGVTGRECERQEGPRVEWLGRATGSNPAQTLLFPRPYLFRRTPASSGAGCSGGQSRGRPE